MRLDGVENAKMDGRDVAEVTYDSTKTTPQDLIAAFNQGDHRYKAAKE